MKTIKDWKVSLKLWMIVLPAISAMVILLVFFIYRTNQISNSAKETLYDDIYKSTSLILNADRDFYQAVMEEKELLWGSGKLTPEEKKVHIDAFEENVQQTRDRIQQAMKNIGDNRQLYTQYKHSEQSVTLKELYESFKDDFSTWMESYNVGNNTGDIGKRVTSFDEARENINLMTEILEDFGSYSTNQMQKGVRRNMIVSIGVISLVILLIGVLAYLIVFYLKTNIVSLTSDMEYLADNNLDFEPCRLDSKDELGALAASVKTLVHSLKKIIGLIEHTSHELFVSSSTMKVNVEEVTQALHEIAKTVGEIAESAGQQAQDTEAVAGEIDLLGQVIQKNTFSTKQITQSMEEIRKATLEGQVVVGRLSEITKTNQKTFESIFDDIRNTNQSVDKIAEASGLIAGITQQTNLLALNASIEAARAGDAGKGFAVVAEEIGKLAFESKESTDIIERMLEDLRRNANEATEQSDFVKEAVENQSKCVEDTDNKYKNIVNSIDSVNRQIQVLEEVSEKMDTSRSHIVDLVASLSAISEENAASTQQTSATTEEVLASMLAISQAGELVEKMSKELQLLVGKFVLPVSS